MNNAQAFSFLNYLKQYPFFFVFFMVFKTDNNHKNNKIYVKNKYFSNSFILFQWQAKNDIT